MTNKDVIRCLSNYLKGSIEYCTDNLSHGNTMVPANTEFNKGYYAALRSVADYLDNMAA